MVWDDFLKVAAQGLELKNWEGLRLWQDGGRRQAERRRKDRKEGRTPDRGLLKISAHNG